MIKLIAGNKDLTEVVEKITWSGDTKQVSRKLSFSIVSKDTDYHLPKVTLNSGEDVVLCDVAGRVLFGGIIFDVDKAASANTTTYLAFDLLFYVNNSDISKVFNDTPEAITAQVCSELGIPFGSAVPTGLTVYIPCLGKKGYEAIMMAYTEASKQNGKKYIPLMQSINKLCVIEKGVYCGVVMDGSYNLTEAAYKTSLQKLVNKVLITDKTGGIISTVEDAESLKYGTIQKVYKQEDGKDAGVEAKALLQSIEHSASVSGISDTRAVSGYALAVQEPMSGLHGLFYIEADTHTFENGKATMQLTLSFSNMMDEKEIQENSEAKT